MDAITVLLIIGLLLTFVVGAYYIGYWAGHGDAFRTATEMVNKAFPSKEAQ